MGRYYDGDINGKFWFAVQSSDDADFFGVQGESSYLSYYFSEDDKLNPSSPYSASKASAELIINSFKTFWCS